MWQKQTRVAVIILKTLEVTVVGFGSVVQNCEIGIFASLLDFPLCVKGSVYNSRELREEELKVKKMPDLPFWLTASFFLTQRQAEREEKPKLLIKF